MQKVREKVFLKDGAVLSWKVGAFHAPATTTYVNACVREFSDAGRAWRLPPDSAHHLSQLCKVYIFRCVWQRQAKKNGSLPTSLSTIRETHIQALCFLEEGR